MESKTLYTLEERLKMAARSEASSPEAAVCLVQHLYKASIVNFFDWGFHRMFDLFSHQVMVEIDEKVSYYGGFCHAFHLTAARYEAPPDQPSPEMSQKSGRNPCRPVRGFQLNNAVVLLGLLMLDHAKGRMRDKTVYRCMRMTLGQYLDALEDLSFRKDGTLDEERVKRRRACRAALFQGYDESKPMRKALADILGCYIAAWQQLHCLGDVDLEREEGTLERVAGQLFLPERDYSPDVMREIDKAVVSLYSLLVEPYLELEEYHCERHLRETMLQNEL